MSNCLFFWLYGTGPALQYASEVAGSSPKESFGLRATLLKRKSPTSDFGLNTFSVVAAAPERLS